MALQYLIDNILEALTRAVRTITNDHAYIHAGKAFKVLLPLTLTTGTTNKTTILTPATGYIHFRPSKISTSGDKVSVNIYEASSGNTGGTTKTPINANRNRTNSATAIVKDGVTVSTNGTLIDSFFVGGGTGVGGTGSGSSVDEIDELVLKQSTLYTIETINGSSATNTILLSLKWYEEER